MKICIKSKLKIEMKILYNWFNIINNKMDLQKGGVSFDICDCYLILLL